ncbi:alpha-(1-_6)-mannopyranosyltransferase A [Skermania piniformis]|uniref:Alpha-(1->6)-mannopyranosyltransferase A n=1 Tax=Skermania pinensis TaxID=39122 RepID=A0ABX8SB41_9ACTN|nr:alpha-(1->6)-mannopyranosyltransferase A [Skermania piniformis]QXQ15078.1 alpha-(1->6)-mannopyranosyltransferase A [Skermania piniformis]
MSLPGSAPPEAPASPRALPTRVRAFRVFLQTAEGHAAALGTVGAVLITVGGLGAGSVRRVDPLLEAAHLSWMRFGHGLVLATIVVWIGVLAMIAAWVRLGRATLAGQVTLNALRATVVLWVTPLLFSVPMFSRDAYSYLAQGALLRDGFDPYAVGPVANPGVLLDNVSEVWTTTTAPYGPAFLLLGEGITTLVGDNVVAGTMLLRLTMLPGLALMMWAIPHLARHLGGKPTVALWLAVLNPLVLVHLIGGVHNEMLMVGLMAAGIALVLERRHVAGIVLVAIGVAIKATAGIALPFLVWIWMVHERERRAQRLGDRTAGAQAPLPHPLFMFAKTAGLGIGVFAAVFATTSALAGVGIGWLTALSGSARIVNWLSLPTILAHMVTWVTPLRLAPVLEVTRLVCAAALLIALVWAWWRFRRTEREAVLGILVAFLAIVVLSPAALPWYYSWPLALGAGFALSTGTSMMLVGLSTWLMLVFQPDGSIGLYSFAHVGLAGFAAYVAARSLRTVDPLHLRASAPATAAPVATAR